MVRLPQLPAELEGGAMMAAIARLLSEGVTNSVFEIISGKKRDGFPRCACGQLAQVCWQ
jgi:hypothetical protein